MTSGGQGPGRDVDDVIIELADRQLDALRRDGVGDPDAADVVVTDPVPVDPAESSLYQVDLEAERDAAATARLDRRRRRS